jgi:thiol:disulfide interchange protein DsbA
LDAWKTAMTRLRRFASIVLLAASALVAGPSPAAPAVPVEGVDYVAIEGGAPFSTPPGTVEVAEVFGYTCPACARFEPQVQAWKRTLPKGVRFVAVPAPFGGHWIPYARAYVAAQKLGIADRSHAAMFRALHDERSLPVSRPSAEEIAGFYAGYGVPPARFVATYNDAATDAELARAREWITRSGVDHTPVLVVAGTWRVGGDSPQDTLRIARWLVDRELAARRR